MRAALLCILLLTVQCTSQAQAPRDFKLAIGESLPSLNPFPYDEEVAFCVGDKVIEKIGATRLEALGITEKNARDKFSRPPFNEIDFTDDEIVSLLDAVDECVAFIDIWEYVVRHSKNAGDWLDTDEINEAFSHCVQSAFSNALPRSLWRTLYTKPNAEFQAKFKELSDPTTGCFEAIFCGKATILGSYGIPATVLPSGGSILFDYGGGSGGLTFSYTLPVLGMNTCPFKATKQKSSSADN